MLCVAVCWLLYVERCRSTWAIVRDLYAVLIVGCCWLLLALCVAYMCWHCRVLVGVVVLCCCGC